MRTTPLHSVGLLQVAAAGRSNQSEANMNDSELVEDGNTTRDLSDATFIQSEITRIEKSREKDNVRMFPGVTHGDLPKNTTLPPLLKNTKDIISTSDTRGIEFISALVALSWGAWVANPFFSVYEHAPEIYSGSAEIAPEWVWGSFIFVVGAVQMTSLAMANRDMRKHASFVAFFMWTLATFAALNGPSAFTTAPVTYPVLTFMSAWAYARQAGC